MSPILLIFDALILPQYTRSIVCSHVHASIRYLASRAVYEDAAASIQARKVTAQCIAAGLISGGHKDSPSRRDSVKNRTRLPARTPVTQNEFRTTSIPRCQCQCLGQQ